MMNTVRAFQYIAMVFYFVLLINDVRALIHVVTSNSSAQTPAETGDTSATTQAKPRGGMELRNVSVKAKSSNTNLAAEVKRGPAPPPPLE